MSRKNRKAVTVRRSRIAARVTAKTEVQKYLTGTYQQLFWRLEGAFKEIDRLMAAQLDVANELIPGFKEKFEAKVNPPKPVTSPELVSDVTKTVNAVFEAKDATPDVVIVTDPEKFEAIRNEG